MLSELAIRRLKIQATIMDEGKRQNMYHLLWVLIGGDSQKKQINWLDERMFLTIFFPSVPERMFVHWNNSISDNVSLVVSILGYNKLAAALSLSTMHTMHTAHIL